MSEPTPPSHLSRLDQQVLLLLAERAVGALGTLEDDGSPAVSMVPFAVDGAAGELILHVSALSAHTRQMQQDDRVSLLVTAADDAADLPQALPRVTVQARARFEAAGSEAAARCQALYLARHPAAELMTQLPDFAFVRLRPTAVRHIAGFGAARSVDPAVFAGLLAAVAVRPVGVPAADTPRAD
ncbi:HugZ family pyridoxamine 5'-phosphate oxidase [Leptothrix discophora]|uniref:Pyridoxamine 5'-phosphate oxidase family protein n=1 Tax=Leptothrix discophora TaxID=89 RepID=A0ABT9G343_LEPDI|nr:pyridoxamine 5'-phosphate oxidase family protein [Leptothrix discophora]MDP4300836.1 pyridoxamine 5'-phosphate oxidase family protein [Leptothrix discophora]